MKIGDLKKLINIEKQTIVNDGMGGQTVTWTTHAANVWAAIWPISAKEIIKSDKEIMVVSHRIRIRYRAGILSSMRIRYGSQYFNIVSIINQNMANRVLDILAKEAT